MKFIAVLIVPMIFAPISPLNSAELSSIQKAESYLELLDLDNAYRIAEPLANQGDRTAQYLLGAVFEKTALFGVTPEDYQSYSGMPWNCLVYERPTKYFQDDYIGKEICWKESSYWYEKSAKQNHPEAQEKIGFAYDIGRGVKKNQTLAIEWYEKAAEQGVPAAIHSMAFAYKEGMLKEKDPQKALKLFKKAADLDYVSSLISLGIMHEEGDGIEVDYTKARKFYLEALKRGATEVAFRLGSMYEDGRGVPMDFVEADKWYEISLRIPIYFDSKKIRRLREKLSADERKEAIRRADEWINNFVNRNN